MANAGKGIRLPKTKKTGVKQIHPSPQQKHKDKVKKK